MNQRPEEESSHLLRRATALARMLDRGTLARLESLGVGPGWRCLEVGAGSGSIASWLCERVGPDGRVLAIDLKPELLAGLTHPNLEVKRHDVSTDEALPGAFDLVHARYMLHWLPQPGEVMRRLVRSLRPGGFFFVEEPDFVTLIHGARSAALGRVIAAGAALGATMTGVDNFYGRELPLEMERLGLTETGSEGRVHMLRGADPSSGTEWLRLCVDWIREPLLRTGTCSEEDITEVYARLADPSFMTPTPITIAAWGRRS